MRKRSYQDLTGFRSAELDDAGVSCFSIDHDVLETALYLNICD